MTSEEPILTDGDIAAVLGGHALLGKETLKRLAQCVQTHPRTEQQLARLQQMTRDAGLDPEASPESIAQAYSSCEDFEALLHCPEWEDPLEVLDPEGLGRGPVEYRALVRIATSRAQRAKEPSRFLAVKEKLQAAQARLEECLRHRDAFLSSLESLRLDVAESLLDGMVSRFQRARRGEVEFRAAAQGKMVQLVEQQLDQLVQEEAKWSHPVQVLPRPRADFQALLRACRLRLAAADGQRAPLERVQAKLEQTVKTAATARRRREKRGAKSAAVIDGLSPSW